MRIFVAIAVISALSGVSGCALFSGGATSTLQSARKLAVLPAAFGDSFGGRACNVCPEGTVFAATDRESADLLTAFVHERLMRYPRYSLLDAGVTEALAPAGMRGAAQQLAATGQAEAVVVPVLIDLRERQGGPYDPSAPAGATLQLLLVDPATGETLWRGVFHRDETDDGRFATAWRRLARGERRRWMTAEEVAAVGVRELVGDMMTWLGGT